MKQSDTKILQHLRQNSRASLTTISRKTGIPVSTIFDRVRNYEQQYVKRFTAIVDFAMLGYPMRTNIFLKVDPASRDALKSYLLAHERVNNLYRVNNGFDFAAECVFTNLKEVEDFLETLEMQFPILDKTVYHIIDDIAREKMLTIEGE